MNIVRFVASVLFMLLSFSSVAKVNLTPPPTPPTTPSLLTFSVERLTPLRPISGADWAKRVSLGIPQNARRCGVFFFVYEEERAGELYTNTESLVEDEGGKLSRKPIPLVYFLVGVPTPSYVYGTFTHWGITTVLSGDVIIPHVMKEDIVACVEDGVAFE